MDKEIELDDTLYDHFNALEEKVTFANCRYSVQNNEELLEAYKKLEAHFIEVLDKLSDYKLINTKKLESFDSNFVYDKNCQQLKEHFNDSIFTNCIDFSEACVYETLQCDYCKIQHLIEHSQDNNDCIKVIKDKT